MTDVLLVFYHLFIFSQPVSEVDHAIKKLPDDDIRQFTYLRIGSQIVFRASVQWMFYFSGHKAVRISLKGVQAGLGAKVYCFITI